MAFSSDEIDRLGERRGWARARGVVAADGTEVPGARVVPAAGAWAGEVGGLPAFLPIHPVRGQIVGLRPATPDRLPLLGPHPEVEGLLLAVGYFRNGILLAPATARLLEPLVTGRAARDVPEAFSPLRTMAETEASGRRRGEDGWRGAPGVP